MLIRIYLGKGLPNLFVEGGHFEYALSHADFTTLFKGTVSQKLTHMLLYIVRKLSH